MSELLMYWSEGNKKVFTKNLCVAERAMSQGFFVMVLRNRSHIFKKQYT